MSRKRSLLPDLYKSKRKYVPAASCSTENGVSTSQGDANGVSGGHDDTKSALLFLRGLFPVEKFEDRLPPIVMKHQIYSLVKNRTQADKQVNDLHSSGEIKIFKLGAEVTDRAIVFTSDYRGHVLRILMEKKLESALIDKVNNMLDHCTDISVDKDRLTKDFKFTDLDISQLVHASVLTVRDVGSWWLSIPNAGIFVKSFIRGRKVVLTMIRKSKYRETLRSELEQRQWPKLARLGISYHIHDIIGAKLIDCIPTTSGELLRLRE